MDNASRENGILLIFAHAFLKHLAIFSFELGGNMDTVGLGHMGPKYSKVYCSTWWRHLSGTDNINTITALYCD